MCVGRKPQSLLYYVDMCFVSEGILVLCMVHFSILILCVSWIASESILYWCLFQTKRGMPKKRISFLKKT